jgi:plasmid stabilization system protein ParE
MAIKNVEFHEEAALEFLAAVEWYLARNELVASRFAEQITDAVQLIAQGLRGRTAMTITT